MCGHGRHDRSGHFLAARAGRLGLPDPAEGFARGCCAFRMFCVFWPAPIAWSTRLLIAWSTRVTAPMRAFGAVCPRNHGLRLPGPDLTRAVRGQRPRLYREASPAVSTRMSGRGSGLLSRGLLIAWSTRVSAAHARVWCRWPQEPRLTAAWIWLEVAVHGSRIPTLAVHNGCLEPSGVSVLACTERRLLRCRPGCRGAGSAWWGSVFLIAWSTRVTAPYARVRGRLPQEPRLAPAWI